MSVIKGVVVKTTAPTSTDDSSKGYYVGFNWINSTTKISYIATSVGVGTATWLIENGDDVSVSAVSSQNQPVPNNFFIPLLMNTEDFDTNDFHKTTAEDTGTALGTQTTTTLQDTSKAWSVNQFANMVVEITGGTGANQVRLILSNTADTLTITGGSGAWTTTPDGTSTYQITISNRCTIPAGKGGKYLIIPKLTFSGNSTGIRGTAMYKNTTFINSIFNNPVGVVESIVLFPPFVLDLVAGDWIEMRGYQTSGGVLNTIGASGTNKVFLQLIAQRGVS